MNAEKEQKRNLIGGGIGAISRIVPDSIEYTD